MGTLDGGVELYDAGTLEELWGQDVSRANADGTMGVALSPGGATLASVSADLTCKLFDSRTGEIRRTMAGHDGAALCKCKMVPLPRGGGECDRVHEQCLVCGHADAVWAASFSPAGRRLATCSRDGTARVWSTHKCTDLPPGILEESPAEGNLLSTPPARGAKKIGGAIVEECVSAGTVSASRDR